MRVIRLTPEEMATADQVGRVVRERYATEVTSRFGAKGKKVPNLSSFVNAYCAEQAIARLLGQSWNRGDDIDNVRSRRADVGEVNEVRWTGAKEPQLRLYDPYDPKSQDHGHLDRHFWLVTGFPPVMKVHGWMSGHAIVKHGAKKLSPEGKWSWYVDPVMLKAPAAGEMLPRLCPGCKTMHPPLYTCAGGWNPWPGPA